MREFTVYCLYDIRYYNIFYRKRRKTPPFRAGDIRREN